jgi:hypothetical protein
MRAISIFSIIPAPKPSLAISPVRIFAGCSKVLHAQTGVRRATLRMRTQRFYNDSLSVQTIGDDGGNGIFPALRIFRCAVAQGYTGFPLFSICGRAV